MVYHIDGMPGGTRWFSARALKDTNCFMVEPECVGIIQAKAGKRTACISLLIPQ